MLRGLIRGQARAEITSNFAIGKKWRTRRRFCVARIREIQHNSLKLRVGETKRELVEQICRSLLHRPDRPRDMAEKLDNIQAERDW